MACLHPLKGFVTGVTKNGKRQIRVTSYLVDHLEFQRGKWIPVSSSYVSDYSFKTVKDFIELPCGHCINCRLEYSRQWADRCMLELQYHKSSYFVTLTYDNDHVPKTYYGDPETGEALSAYTLRKRDFQLFMKRLRERTGQELRFFASGEYGSNTFRPHYHAIIFGLSLPKREIYSKSSLGFIYYTSDLLDDIWGNGKCVIAPVTWETCAYTARYVLKKLRGDQAQFYDDFNLEPEFSLMSRRPGIAYQYFVDHPDIVTVGYTHVATDKGGRKIRSSRYFDSLFDLDHPDDLKRIKNQRMLFAIRERDEELSHTTKSYLDYLEVKEEYALDRANSLIRKDF